MLLYSISPRSFNQEKGKHMLIKDLNRKKILKRNLNRTIHTSLLTHDK